MYSRAAVGQGEDFVRHVGCLCHRPEILHFTNRINGDLTRRGFTAGMAASILSLGLPNFAGAQSTATPEDRKGKLVFTNFRLFDGKSTVLTDGKVVVVDGNSIASVEDAGGALPEDAEHIDCGGRTLMPGLIDAHWHTMLAPMPLTSLMTAELGYIYLVASAEAERTLLRGFTTVRDVGGPVFALKKAIDEGVATGPRIYPSGAMISQTGGHGDFRPTFELPRKGDDISRSEELGAAAIADGADEVLRRAREQLMLGASQIKLMAGGGISSLYDPLDSLQFRPEEVEAAVQAAADWGTYVTVHVYLAEGMKRCIKAGVRCIEHGQLADEEAARMVADNGIWWSLQPFIEAAEGNQYTGAQAAKQRQVWEGTDKAYAMAIDLKAKIGWGTDVLFNPKGTANQGRMLSIMTRWFTAGQALKIATGDNGEMLALSGERNPYPGKLGVIERGALADILLVDGDPTEDLGLLANPEANLKLVMKDGRIYKREV